jgi:predicted transcriptional regulator
MNSKFAVSYVQYLQLLHAFESTPNSLSQLDEKSKRLLNMIVLFHYQGKNVTTKDLMWSLPMASPPTIYRMMTKLVEAGLVEQIFIGKNRRSKYFIPTDKAGQYFEKLGELMCAAFRDDM